MLSRLGMTIDLDIERWGWYPLGGGTVTARVSPHKEFLPLEAVDRGKLLSVTGISAVSNLPLDIAVRQRDQRSQDLHRGVSTRTSRSSPHPRRARGPFCSSLPGPGTVQRGLTALARSGKGRRKWPMKRAGTFFRTWIRGALSIPALRTRSSLTLLWRGGPRPSPRAALPDTCSRTSGSCGSSWTEKFRQKGRREGREWFL